MILFTTGHEQFQFDYLMRMVQTVRESFPDEPILVQYGRSNLVPQGQGIESVQLLSSEKFREAVENARVIVSHCGEGNLLLLQEVGRPFVLVPRTRQRREHVDDHQLELATVLAKSGLPIAFGPDDLRSHLEKPQFVRYEFPSDKITEALIRKNLPGERILLVSSSGGHFRLLKTLERYWERFPHRVWVTFENSTTRVELEGETVVWAHHPTNRNVPNLMRNLVLAHQTLRRIRPDVVLSTGAGVAVPFLLQAKLMRRHTVFIESITRVKDLSASARMLRAAHAIDTLIVQHRELGEKYPQATSIE